MISDYSLTGDFIWTVDLCGVAILDTQQMCGNYSMYCLFMALDLGKVNSGLR